jgi:hypothetical protein
LFWEKKSRNALKKRIAAFFVLGTCSILVVLNKTNLSAGAIDVGVFHFQFCQCLVDKFELYACVFVDVVVV